MTRGSERAGLGFAALCALNGAFVAPVARLTTEAGNPLYVAAATTLFAALAAFCVLLVRGQLRALVSGPDAAVLAGLGALGTMVPSLLFFLGTSRTSALDAVLCLQVEPAYALLFAWLVLGHRLRGEALWPDRIEDAQLPVLALQGVVLSFVGTMLWYQAIARLDLARATAIVVPSIPLLSLATAAAIVGELPTARQVAGLCMVAAGVLSFVLAPHAVEVLERVPAPTAPIVAEAGDEAGGDAA